MVEMWEPHNHDRESLARQNLFLHYLPHVTHPATWSSVATIDKLFFRLPNDLWTRAWFVVWSLSRQRIHSIMIVKCGIWL